MENGVAAATCHNENKLSNSCLQDEGIISPNSCNHAIYSSTTQLGDKDVLMTDVDVLESPQSPDPEKEEERPTNHFPVLHELGESRNNGTGEENHHHHLPIVVNEENAFIDRDNDPAWEEERRHYLKIVNTFRSYSDHTLKKLGGINLYIKSMPKEHQRLLSDYRKHLHAVRRCVDENQNLCILMILEESHLFENQKEVYPKKRMKQAPPQPTNFDFDKMQAVFKQIARDWSEDGKAERDSCYKPMIEEIERIFGDTKNEDGLSPIKILVPGAGLGRLAHELVCKGYTVEGNEFSLFMLFASNFLLNRCEKENQYKCFPWVHQTINVLNRDDQIRPVYFPDIKPTELPPNSQFSMTAGDFCDVYATPSHKEGWDAVVTCFFIDCANNVVAYLERIYSCLKLGGYWVNMGPLLYHYADLPEEKSIEPPYDILREIIQKMGFVIEKEETNRPTFYAHNSKSMLSYTYNSVFLVCKKGLPAEPRSSSASSSPTKRRHDDTS